MLYYNALRVKTTHFIGAYTRFFFLPTVKQKITLSNSKTGEMRAKILIK